MVELSCRCKPGPHYYCSRLQHTNAQTNARTHAHTFLPGRQCSTPDSNTLYVRWSAVHRYIVNKSPLVANWFLYSHALLVCCHCARQTCFPFLPSALPPTQPLTSLFSFYRQHPYWHFHTHTHTHAQYTYATIDAFITYIDVCSVPPDRNSFCKYKVSLQQLPPAGRPFAWQSRNDEVFYEYALDRLTWLWLPS